jgi:emp24/gp25L/p24 family/GOLD
VLHDDVDSDELIVRVSNMDTGDTLYEIPTGELEGDFELTDLQGNSRFQICFQSNTEGSNHNDAFDLGFNVRFHEPPRTLDDGESGPDGERAAKLVEKAAKIHQDWDTLQDHFDFLRNREAIHEEMNDAIISRLTRWTYIEAFLVVGMATGQVMYWKKFFEKRRYL